MWRETHFHFRNVYNVNKTSNVFRRLKAEESIGASLTIPLTRKKKKKNLTALRLSYVNSLY